jgi:hypothetical protein
MTTKTEALKLALEALWKSEPLPTEDDDDYAEAGWRRHEQAIIASKEALAQPEQEPLTEWLVCPKCSCKSPYSPIKAKTLAEDAERITKQTRAALAQPEQEPTRHCRSCGVTGERHTGVDESPTTICKPCDGTGQTKGT